MIAFTPPVGEVRSILSEVVGTVPPMELPIGLTTAIETGNCVLFIGAGIGEHLRQPGGGTAPNGSQLARKLAADLDVEGFEDALLPQVAQLYVIRKGRQELHTFLKDEFRDLEPDDTFRWLFGLTWKAIFTTNYDRAIERAYELDPSSRQNPITVCDSSQLVAYNSNIEVPVFHLHGCLYEGSRAPVVITEEDYALFSEHRRMLFDILRTTFATTPILYVGYGHTDSNWKTLFSELRTEFAPSIPAASFRVAPSTSVLEAEILKSQGVTTLDGSLRDLVAALEDAVGSLEVDPRRLDEARGKIPTDFLHHFDRNPAPLLRFLSSWNYVNQAPFHKDPNIKSFLNGDHANWALISQRNQFERDVEDSMMEELLDFATSPDASQPILLAIGPAGYGISTILMSIAYRLVQAKAGAVLRHKRGRAFHAADVEFALSLSSGPIFLVIDNAADNAREALIAYRRIKDLDRAVCFVLGDRLNEWRQTGIRLPAKEFGIEPLSEGEIGRLLDCLGSHDALGKLTSLDRPMQHAVVREVHQKELLVAMKEVTEGKGFNAIIEDEYHGLANEESRSLYAAVACFDRLRAVVRDQSLASMLDLNLAEMHRLTGTSTEGVVVYEDLDEDEGTFVARTRHHKIGDIVWQRAVDANAREELTRRALQSLNLNYPSDAKAFELFVRSDLVDAIRTVEGRIEFFELACKKDPDSPYVRQHYARMLRRAERPGEALVQIEKAISDSPGTRVLYHTKGLILADLALSQESLEMARRRMAQSEACFEQELAMNDRDEYAYHGLAELYFNWARRVESEDERVMYLAKSEAIISSGLRVARNKESLYIISSQVQAFLGDNPGARGLLETAAELHPENRLVGYLLARTYFRQGDPKRAMDLLNPILLADPEEFRSAVLAARCLDSLNEPYEKAIAILAQSELYGFKDPRWVATYGGMLFMNGKFSEAEDVFTRAQGSGFTFQELMRPEYRPHEIDDASVPLRLEGEVTTVKAGYAFVESAGYSSFFCHASRYGETVMTIGKRVTFEPAFNARGAVALEPRDV